MIRRRSHRLLLGLLALLALALRAPAPAGWMPVADAQGIRIALCSGEGALVLARDGSLRREAPADPADKAPHDPCPYALAGHAALDLPAVPALADVAAPAPIAAPAPRLARWPLASRPAPRPPTRGPPVHA